MTRKPPISQNRQIDTIRSHVGSNPSACMDSGNCSHQQPQDIWKNSYPTHCFLCCCGTNALLLVSPGDALGSQQLPAHNRAASHGSVKVLPCVCHRDGSVLSNYNSFRPVRHERLVAFSCFRICFLRCCNDNI